MKTSASFRPRLYAVGLCSLIVASMAGCGGGDDPMAVTPGTPAALSVQYVLAPVNGGACRVVDAAGKTLLGPVTTQSGTASFSTLPAAVSGLQLVACEGGTYSDESTGATLAGPRLRAYATLGADTPSVSVTPLTEIAVALLGSRSAASNYKAVQTSVATAFGLEDMDLSAVVPTDISKTALTDNPAGRYGVALAALSQLVANGFVSKDVMDLISQFAGNFDNEGHIKDEVLRDEYGYALEDLLDNTRLLAKFETSGFDILQALYDNTQAGDPLASVEYVNTDFSSTRTGEAVHIVPANAPSTIEVVGRNLYLGLEVTLGGAKCHVRDLGPLDEAEISTPDEQLFVDCPALAVGTASLIISDEGQVVSQTEMTVASANVAKRAVKNALRSVGAGPANVTGTVTAHAPTVNTTTGGHNYAELRTFAVKGVVVELLDRGAADAVLMQTNTDMAGKYTFAGVDAGKNVVVRVKAQLLSTLATGMTTGPQWDMAVRDNTSTTKPKAMYSLDGAATTTVAGENTVNVNAGVGFDSTGRLDAASAGRQSAPFSILEVMYSAIVKIQETDANLALPGLNVYWSPANVGASGDKNKGQISTSHYARNGLMPGVFILGKADVDTDEFDQGVIGHEFGHYLQAQLSYSDSPGGSHGNDEFKDASLAYGEGYGTAIGGLLSGSPFYIDSSGELQGRGGVTDLNKASGSTKRKGFYSEESVAYVMYQMGVRHGFGPVWKAVSAMKSNHHSATLFAFLSQFMAANPSADIADLLTAENIRSTDPLGTLPAGASPDAAINAVASKGATDLEMVYVPMVLNPVQAQVTSVLASSEPAQFCVNHKLRGAKNGNGLGMHKRFVFKAAFTGDVGIKVFNGMGKALDLQDYSLNGRSDAGADVSFSNWSEGMAQLSVVEGRTYTVRFSVDSPASVFNGNSCGNKLSLWRVAA